MSILGKRFVFGCVAVVCVSITACLLKYDGEIYFKLIGVIAGLFLTAQTITDSLKK